MHPHYEALTTPLTGKVSLGLEQLHWSDVTLVVAFVTFTHWQVALGQGGGGGTQQEQFN
jgi:hypothetical protein